MITHLRTWWRQHQINRRDKRRGYTDADVDRVNNKMHHCTRLPGAAILLTPGEMNAWRAMSEPAPAYQERQTHPPQRNQHGQ